VKDLESAISRFRTEARSAGRLRHPNIITVFDASIEGDTPFIVMDYVEGASLESVIQSQGALEPERVLRLSRQLAEALDEAHRQGVLHRDIKPSNLVVDAQDRLYVLDFGVARLNESIQGNQPNADKDGQSSEPVVGTPAYMSPEQILNKKLDHRSDLFSFALVVFELFTGARPFPGTTFKEVVNGILSSSPTAISSLVPNLPLQLEVEFEHALAKRPEDRFNSAVETVRIFESALVGKSKLPAVQGGPNSGSRKRSSEWKSIGGRPPNSGSTSIPNSGQFRQDPPQSERGRAVHELVNVNPHAGFGSAGHVQPGHYSPGEVFAHDEREIAQNVKFRKRLSLIRIAITLLALVSLFAGSTIAYKIYKGEDITAFLNSDPAPMGPDVDPDLLAKTRILKPKIVLAPEPGNAGGDLSGVPTALTDSQLYAILTDPSADVSRLLEVLEIAAERKIPGIVDASGKLLSHQNYLVRIQAAEAIGKSGDRDAGGAVLLEHLDDFDPSVRVAITKAIGTLGSAKAIGYLRRQYGLEENELVKKQIRATIEKISGLPFKPGKG
ncbi:MAG: protein kinase, partial [Bdellovibrionales bacterium]|nr:protein kinase [Bdellovibrionales bacterium]